jgi:hypothetical protein
MLNPKFSLRHWEKVIALKDPVAAKRYIATFRKAGLK